MMFTPNMIKKAEKAASAEELLEMSKAEGIDISIDEASKYFNLLHGSVELTEDDLTEVAGGKGSSTPAPKFREGQTVVHYYFSTNNAMKGKIKGMEYSIGDWKYNIHYDQKIEYDKYKNPIYSEFYYDNDEYLENKPEVTVSD